MILPKDAALGTCADSTCDKYAFGNILFSIRKARNLSITSVAKKLGISETYYKSVEVGAKKPFIGCQTDKDYTKLLQSAFELSDEETEKLSRIAYATRKAYDNFKGELDRYAFGKYLREISEEKDVTDNLMARALKMSYLDYLKLLNGEKHPFWVDTPKEDFFFEKLKETLGLNAIEQKYLKKLCYITYIQATNPEHPLPLITAPLMTTFVEQIDIRKCDKYTFGTCLQYLRITNNISIDKLASYLGYTLSSYKNIEKGRKRCFNILYTPSCYLNIIFDLTPDEYQRLKKINGISFSSFFPSPLGMKKCQIKKEAKVFGNTLRIQRESKHLSVENLAQYLNLSISYYLRVEDGLTRPFIGNDYENTSHYLSKLTVLFDLREIDQKGFLSIANHSHKYISKLQKNKELRPQSSNYTMCSFGNNLLWFRVSSNLTSFEVATKLGMTEYNYYLIEIGNVIPDLDFCSKISELFLLSEKEKVLLTASYEESRKRITCFSNSKDLGRSIIKGTLFFKDFDIACCNSKTFGAVLKKLRESVGLSVSNMVEHLRIQAQTYYEIENGTKILSCDKNKMHFVILQDLLKLSDEETQLLTKIACQSKLHF